MPSCVDSAVPQELIDPANGSLRLQLGFTLPEDARVVVRGVGLHVVADEDGPVQREIARIKAALEQLEDHTHVYKTGRGVGHNNTNADTSEPVEAGHYHP